MNNPTTFLFLVLFIPKNIFSTQSTTSSSEHDVKTCLRDWLNTISEKTEKWHTKIDDAVKKAFASAEHHRVKEIEYNVTDLADTFKSKIIFHDINFYTHHVDAEHTNRFSLLTPKQKLSGDKISVSTRNLRITLEVELRKEKDERYVSLFTTLHFNDFVLNATRKSSDPNNATFSFNMSYGQYYVYNYGYYIRIKWDGIVSDEPDSSSDKDNSNKSDSSSDEDNSNKSDSSSDDDHSNESDTSGDEDNSNKSDSSSDDDHSNESDTSGNEDNSNESDVSSDHDTSYESRSSRYKIENRFTTEITPMLPKLLHEHINRNPEFSQAFNEIPKAYHPPANFISLYPRLKNHREVIPQVPFYGFRLRNIVILGLTNIESIDIDEFSVFFTHTLWVENIRGSLTLDYGCTKETPLELNYQISYLLISFKENTDLVNAEARGYRVSPIAGGSLTDLQSAVVMEKIESVAASVLMPSKKFWKPCSFESKIEKIQNTSTRDWNTIKELYQNWIPFNQHVAPRKP